MEYDDNSDCTESMSLQNLTYDEYSDDDIGPLATLRIIRDHLNKCDKYEATTFTISKGKSIITRAGISNHKKCFCDLDEAVEEESTKIDKGDKTAALVIPKRVSKSISLHHAKLYAASFDECFIEDLQSKNGTRIISQSGRYLVPNRLYTLQDGDIVCFGDTKFELRFSLELREGIEGRRAKTLRVRDVARTLRWQDDGSSDSDATTKMDCDVANDDCITEKFVSKDLRRTFEDLTSTLEKVSANEASKECKNVPSDANSKKHKRNPTEEKKKEDVEAKKTKILNNENDVRVLNTQSGDSGKISHKSSQESDKSEAELKKQKTLTDYCFEKKGSSARKTIGGKVRGSVQTSDTGGTSDLAKKRQSTPATVSEAPICKLVYTGTQPTNQHKNLIKKWGWKILDNWPGKQEMPTHIIADSIKRTSKFLCALCWGIPIVTMDFIKECENNNGLAPDWEDHALRDIEGEARYKFKLKDSIKIAQEKKIFNSYDCIYFSVNLKTLPQPPPPKEVLDAIALAGGVTTVKWLPPTKIATSISKSKETKALIIAKDKDEAKIIDQECGTESYEFEMVIDAALRQSLNFDSFKLN